MTTERIALITGAIGGIGFETARQLARKNFTVVLTGRKKKAGESAAHRIHNEGGQALFLLMDVSDPKSIQSAAKTFAKISPRLDVLINNAAILLDKKDSLLATNLGDLASTFRTNVIGPVAVAQAFIPFLKKSKSPRIVNVSSGAGSLNEMGLFAPAYSISKTALNAVTKQLGLAVGKSGISVNSVCPGWVRTKMGGKEAPRSVEEGADTIVWLAADAPQNLTGQFLRDRAKAEW